MAKKTSPTNYRMLIGVLLAITLLFLVFLAFKNYKVEKFIQDSKKVTIILVHASWCPHCTDYIESGVYSKTAASLSKKPEYIGKVEFIDLEYEKNKKRVEALGVTGFPSIVAVTKDSDGKEVKILDFSTFRSDPKPDRENPQDLEAFVKAALDTQSNAS